MSTVERKAATIDDLYKVEGKAELVNGEIMHMSPTGEDHGLLVGMIFSSLREFAKTRKLGRAFPDNTAFLCNLPNRQSFAPDVSFYQLDQPRSGKKFLPQSPLFAVEIRSAGDYGPRAEKTMATKRADYFAAGTKAVWDVDPDGPIFVRLYLAGQPENPVEFRMDDIAHAEPVLPGWRLAVNDIIAEIQ